MMGLNVEEETRRAPKEMVRNSRVGPSLEALEPAKKSLPTRQGQVRPNLWNSNSRAITVQGF